mmetsp:Transcript_38289/g.68342  ORF Transcript_38289/g.68342 Transcript_38289/m.68342 type:complete len:409 (-) Transcript_38289:1988-3214(-)
MANTPLDEIFTFIITPHEIENTPSRADGIDSETEDTLRMVGCEMIQEAGILLKLPQVVMARALVLFHRFYCRKSFKRCPVRDTTMAALFLACKLEEVYKKIRVIALVFYRVFQRRDGVRDPATLSVGSPEYFNMKKKIISYEYKILRELGFVLHVEHPHKFILFFCRMLADEDKEGNQKFAQTAWNILNDSLRTTLCIRYPPETIACGAIYLAGRVLQRPLPENPPWWTLFDAQTEDLIHVCNTLAWMYRQPKPKEVAIELVKDDDDDETPGNTGVPPSPAGTPLPATTPSQAPVLHKDDKEEGKDKGADKAKSKERRRSRSRSRSRDRSRDHRRSRERKRRRSRDRDRRSKDHDRRDRSVYFFSSLSPRHNGDGTRGGMGDAEHRLRVRPYAVPGKEGPARGHVPCP